MFWSGILDSVDMVEMESAIGATGGSLRPFIFSRRMLEELESGVGYDILLCTRRDILFMGSRTFSD